jgi:cell division protein ZapA (FtsZ GTPase activity inhibitor)
MKNAEVLLELFGREFIIKALPEQLEQLKASVALLKARATKVDDEYPNQGFNRVLVLAALTIAADYLQLKNEEYDPIMALEARIHALHDDIQDVMEKCPL